MFCPKCGTENPDNGRFCRSCGTHLQQVTQVLNATADSSAKEKSSDTRRVEALGKGTKEIISGLGFVICAVIVYYTNFWGGQFWWWTLLFPAFGSLAKGVSEMVKYQTLKTERAKLLENSAFPQPQIANQATPELPLIRADYVSPQKSKLATGELPRMPPSVTEDTTRRLEIDSENETMTLGSRDKG